MDIVTLGASGLDTILFVVELLRISCSGRRGFSKSLVPG